MVDPLALVKWDAGVAPLMMTEFGGISLSANPDDWGYASVTSPAEYRTIVGELFDALRAAPTVVGFCYTQFMDTGRRPTACCTPTAPPSSRSRRSGRSSPAPPTT